MPHIPAEISKKFEDLEKVMGDTYITDKAELEYLIARLQTQYALLHEIRYAYLHDVVYATEHAANEFKIRFLDIYEDFKENENGSAYMEFHKKFEEDFLKPRIGDAEENEEDEEGEE